MNLKKIIALALCVCMVLSFFPVSVFAEDWEDEVVLVDEEEYFEPQDEYVEEEIIIEEPVDYVEYVEPAEEIVVEDELPAEEPAEELIEEPAEELIEEPAAPATPVEEAAAPAAMTAELETAETFDAVGPDDVASIGQKGYTSIQAAVADALTGLGEIKLLKDTTEELVELKQGGDPVIITGSDYAMPSVKVSEDANSLALTVKSIKDLTVSAGTVVLTDTTVNGAVKVTGGTLIVTRGELKGEVTISGGEVVLKTNSSNEDGISISAGKLSISGGTYVSVTGTGTGTGNITGGTFETKVTKALLADGYVTKDFENDRTYGTGEVEKTTKAAMYVKDGKRVYADLTEIPSTVIPTLVNDATLNLTASNSPFSVKLNDNTLTITCADGSYTEETDADGVTTYTWFSVVATATVNGVTTPYSSFEEAVHAAYNGGTVELYKDVVSDPWDQNTWAYGYSVGPNNLTINGNGHVWTIKSLTGNVIGNGDDIFHGATNLSISKLTIKQQPAAGVAMRGLQMKSGSLSEVTIEGGDFAVYNGGLIKIDKCTFDGQGWAAVYWEAEEAGTNTSITNSTFKNCNATDVMGNMTFQNNTIESTASVNFGYNFPAAVMTEEAQAKFTGNIIKGTVNLYQNGAVKANDLSKATFVVQDARPVDAVDLSGNYFGDSLPVNIPEQVVISSVAANTEYTATTPVVASVLDGQGKETFYATLAAAVTAAGKSEDSKVISLMANIADPYVIDADQTLKVKHNGKTLNVTYSEIPVIGVTDPDDATVTIYTANATAEAMIGTTPYLTLKAAINAANVTAGTDPVTVQVLKDVTVENPPAGAVFTVSRANVTIVGAGNTPKTIKGVDNNVNHVIITTNATNVKLENLIIVSDGCGACVTTNDGCNIALEDVYLDHSKGFRGDALMLNGNCDINGTFGFSANNNTWHGIVSQVAGTEVDFRDCTEFDFSLATNTAAEPAPGQAFFGTLPGTSFVGLDNLKAYYVEGENETEVSFVAVDGKAANRDTGFEPSNSAKITSKFIAQVGTVDYESFATAAAAAKQAGTVVTLIGVEGTTYDPYALTENNTLQVKLNSFVTDATVLATAPTGYRVVDTDPVAGVVTLSLAKQKYNLSKMESGSPVVVEWYDTFDHALADVQYGDGQFIVIKESHEHAFTADGKRAMYVKAEGEGVAFTYTTPTGYEVKTRLDGSGSESTLYELTPITYTLTYDYDDATTTPENPVTYTVETETFALIAPEKTNYGFGGWYVDGATDAAASVTITKGSTGNHSYKAKWVGNALTVTINGMGGTTADGKTEIVLDKHYNDTFDITEYANVFSLEHYHAGTPAWFNHTTGNYYIPSTVTYNFTLEAQWAIDTNEVKFYNGELQYGNPQVINYNELATKPTTDPTAETGYHFSAWYEKKSDGTLKDEPFDFTTPITAPVNLYAKFDPNEHTAKFQARNDAGEIVTVLTEPVNYGAVITVPENNPTRNGYTFSGWTPDVPDTMPDSNMTFTAVWTKNTYTITLDANGGTVDPNTKTYQITDTFNLPEPTYEQNAMVFTGWKVTTVAENNTNWELAKIYTANDEISGMYGDVTLTAQWITAEAKLTTNNGTIVYKPTIDEALAELNGEHSGWYTNNPFIVLNAAKVTYDKLEKDNTLTLKLGEFGDTFTVLPLNNNGTTYNPEEPGDTYYVNDPTENEDGTVTYTTSDYVAYVKTQAFTYSQDNYGVWTAIPGLVTYTLHDTFAHAAADALTAPGGERPATVKTVVLLTANPTTYELTETALATAGELRIDVGTIGSANLKAEEGTRIQVQNVEGTIYRYYLVDTVTVTFSMNGKTGTAPAALTIDKGAKATRPETDPTTSDKFTFTNWYANEAATGDPFNFDTTITADTIIYAGWIAYPTVTFVTATGVPVPEAQSVPYNSPASNPGPINRDYYDFQGWYTSATPAATDTPFDFNNTPITENKTLYAWYTPVEYTINYYLNGGSLAEGVTNPTKYTVETETFTLKNPTKANWTFDGWTGSNGEATGQSTVTITKGSHGDLEFGAHYKYTATFVMNGGTPVVPAQTNMERVLVTKPAPDPTLTDATFKGWYADAAFEHPFDFNTAPDGNVTLYAKFVGDPRSIVFMDDDYTHRIFQTYNMNVGDTLPAYKPNPLPTRTGYALDETDLWNPSIFDDQGNLKKVTTDQVFNLKWKQLFTVDFEVNGIVIKSIENVKAGDTIAENQAPYARKEGKDAKWLLNGEPFGFGTTPVESNLKLVASWDDTPATLADFTYNMSLTENLNMKFYVRNVKDNIDDYTVKVSIDGKDDQFFYLDNAEENIFTIAEFDARRMTDEIHVFVTDGDAVVLDKVYTIAGYCNAVIESTGNQKLKELANAILVYGANAQLALNYKTDNLPTDEHDVSGVIIPAATAKTKGSVTGVSRFGNQVMVDSNVTLRVLLQVDSTASLDDYTVTVNDTEVVPVKQSATIWYVDIPVSALKLGERQIVYVEDDDGMATYALTTIVPMKRVNNYLARALYAYYDAATAYATSI